MGRVAVYELLGADPGLNALGIVPEHLWPNFALDRSPRRAGPWMVMRWGAVTSRFNGAANRQDLTLWVYTSRQEGTDYALIDRIIKRTVTVMLGAVHHVGSDGSVLHTAGDPNFSGDLTDSGYDAITRNVNLNVLTSDPV